MLIPSMLLKKLYTLGSLKNAEPGVQFAVKNRLSDAELTGLKSIAIDGKPIALREVTLELADGKILQPDQISAANPIAFDVAVEVNTLSKTYSMAGFRVGFALGNERLIAALARVKSYLDYGAYPPVQVAAAAALNGPQDCVEEMRQTYKRRRDVLIDQLR